MSNNGTTKTRKKRSSSEKSRNKRQSPINISRDVVVQNKSLRGSLLRLNYIIGDAEYIKVSKTGFICICNEESSLTASHLNRNADYRLWQFHMHWSDTNKKGSEHCIDGRFFPAEIHCVFWNKKLGNKEKAMKHPNGLTVLGLFVEVSEEDNPVLSPIIDAIEKAIQTDDEVAVSSNFDLAELLPAKKSYYSYEGSLTTPSYDECVSWILLHNRISMSEPQLSVLRKIINHNARSIQNLNNREICASFRRVPRKY